MKSVFIELFCRIFHVYPPQYDFRHTASTDRRNTEDNAEGQGNKRDYNNDSGNFGRGSSSSYKTSGSHGRDGNSREWPQDDPVDNELDLDRELFALDHFVDDKPRLIQEAFGILQGRRLEAMVPTTLKVNSSQ